MLREASLKPRLPWGYTAVGRRAHKKDIGGFRAWESVTEPLRIAGVRDRHVLRDRAIVLLEQVGLQANYLDRFTHELSGGQRQRLGIAGALSASPDLIIADEAVSALDATTRLQVLELFTKLQIEIGLPFLFITHDFAVVTRVARRVAVLRFGRLVEIGPTAAVLEQPRHPYTRALASAAKGAGVRLETGERGHRVDAPGSQPAWLPLVKVGAGHFVEEVYS